MTATAWAFTNGGRTKLLDGTWDIDTNTWKCALHTVASNIAAGSTTWGGVTGEVAAGNGYSAGGFTAFTLTLSGTTTVTVTFSTNPNWNATSAGITARWAVIYKSAGDVLCYSELDGAHVDVVCSAGNTLTVAASGSGIFQLA